MNPLVLDTSTEYLQNLTNIHSKNVIEADTNQNYVMLQFDKDMVCKDDQLRGKYSSVVIDPDTRNVLSIGPPKTIPYDLFQELFKEEVPENIIWEPLLEGVFVQLFYDYRANFWEISTRNSISGKYAFYRMKDDSCPTFREMFYDAIGLGYEDPLSTWTHLESLDKKCCYHFILQHPKHHIIYPISTPTLHLVGKTQIGYDNIRNNVHISNKLSLYEEYHKKFQMIQPLCHDLTLSEESATEILQTMQMSHMNIGIIITHVESGQQTTLMQPKYNDLLVLRGTNPNLFFQYICLRKINRVSDFLKQFPMYKDKFWDFKKVYDHLVILLHKTYYQFFITKQKPQIDKHLHYHIHQIHNNIFIPSLQSEKVIIKKPIVAEYVRNLEPGCVFHLLNV